MRTRLLYVLISKCKRRINDGLGRPGKYKVALDASELYKDSDLLDDYKGRQQAVGEEFSGVDSYNSDARPQLEELSKVLLHLQDIRSLALISRRIRQEIAKLCLEEFCFADLYRRLFCNFKIPLASQEQASVTTQYFHKFPG